MTKPNRSRKTIRPNKARARTDHPAGCRVNSDELAAVRADIDLIAQTSGIKPSLGNYTKHALLSYPRFRRLEVGLRKLLADKDVELYLSGEFVPQGLDVAKFYNDVKALLEGL